MIFHLVRPQRHQHRVALRGRGAGHQHPFQQGNARNHGRAGGRKAANRGFNLPGDADGQHALNLQPWRVTAAIAGRRGAAAAGREPAGELQCGFNAALGAQAVNLPARRINRRAVGRQ